MKFYEVGGAVRDYFMSVAANDMDFAVEASSFSEMENELKEQGYTIYLVKPEYYTIRAMIPPQSVLRSHASVADFVLCRKDGPTKDGRRPEYVEPGTIIDDLARRDFTMNAIARDVDTGTIIDPHEGIADIRARLLRFVGDPMQRIVEDGLRVIRAYRFMVTHGVTAERVTHEALVSREAAMMVSKVSVDRIREELHKMFLVDTMASIDILSAMPIKLLSAIFRDGLRLMPSTRRT